jgi:hypothetical protein
MSLTVIYLPSAVPALRQNDRISERNWGVWGQ